MSTDRPARHAIHRGLHYPNPNKQIERGLIALEGLLLGLNDIDLDGLDPQRKPAWAQELGETLRALEEFRARLSPAQDIEKAEREARGRRMTDAREARLGRVGWRQKAVELDHKLCQSAGIRTQAERAKIIGQRLGLHPNTVREALPHDAKHGLKRPRRRQR